MRLPVKIILVAFGLLYLLIELFYIGMPVVRTDGRSGGRSVGVRSRGYQNFRGWVVTTFSYPWCSAIIIIIIIIIIINIRIRVDIASTLFFHVVKRLEHEERGVY